MERFNRSFYYIIKKSVIAIGFLKYVKALILAIK